MSNNSKNLETGAIILNGTGAVRSHGQTVYAWVAMLPNVNDGGIVFDCGLQSKIQVVKESPCYIENVLSGKLINGSISNDGHYVVRCEIENVPEWISRNDCGYAIPQYESKTLTCSRCGVLHQRHSTPCDCIRSSPALILSEVKVVGLCIYKRRCDDYIKAERNRLLDWMFNPVMPITPLFMPGFKNATSIPKDSSDT
jgi:hypothetical protein